MRTTCILVPEHRARALAPSLNRALASKLIVLYSQYGSVVGGGGGGAKTDRLNLQCAVLLV